MIDSTVIVDHFHKGHFGKYAPNWSNGSRVTACYQGCPNAVRGKQVSVIRHRGVETAIRFEYWAVFLGGLFVGCYPTERYAIQAAASVAFGANG